MTKSNAVVLTGGFLDTNNAKTAHGLIRGSDRYEIVGVIDPLFAGKDAGMVLDGHKRDIAIFKSISDFVERSGRKAQYCIIGIATKGGVLPESLKNVLKDALSCNLSIVNGLHEYVSDIPELAKLATQKGLEIIDVRKPKRAKDLHFWSGRIKEVECPKIAVLGTDCALGKRTTTRMLTRGMNEAGFKAEMIYTGQTGWMQGAKYGFIFDSTLNDFISGELEHALWTCYQEEKPDIIFIEGQSSLRNPSGPAGAEWILSADATSIVLQHSPARKKYKGLESYPVCIPSLEEEIQLIKMYGADTVAVTVNTHEMTLDEAREYAQTKEAELHVPVVLPLEEGVGRVVSVLSDIITRSNA